jgi:hypothetical protein
MSAVISAVAHREQECGSLVDFVEAVEFNGDFHVVTVSY